MTTAPKWLRDIARQTIAIAAEGGCPADQCTLSGWRTSGAQAGDRELVELVDALVEEHGEDEAESMFRAAVEAEGAS